MNRSSRIFQKAILSAKFLKRSRTRSVIVKRDFSNVNFKPFALNAANIHIADGYRDYKAFGGQVHEAGYDAWMTGVAFIHMMGYLNLVSK